MTGPTLRDDLTAILEAHDIAKESPWHIVCRCGWKTGMQRSDVDLRAMHTTHVVDLAEAALGGQAR